MSKRQAEKDQLAAGNFFLTVNLPPTVTMVTDAEAPLDLFKKTTRGIYTTWILRKIRNKILRIFEVFRTQRWHCNWEMQLLPKNGCKGDGLLATLRPI